MKSSSFNKLRPKQRAPFEQSQNRSIAALKPRASTNCCQNNRTPAEPSQNHSIMQFELRVQLRSEVTRTLVKSKTFNADSLKVWSHAAQSALAIGTVEVAQS